MRIPLEENWTLFGAGFVLANQCAPVDIPRALSQAGIARGADVGLDGLGNEWIFRRTWTLETTILLEQFTHERAVLSLPGLVGRGEIRIDGKQTTAFEGPAECEVTAAAARGRAVVAIVFAPQDGAACRPFGLGRGAQIRGINSLRLLEWSVHTGDEALRAFLSLEVYTPGKYVFRYAFEQDGVALGALEFEHALPAVPCRLEHLLEAKEGFPEAVRWHEGRENAPLCVRLLVLRRGEACDAAVARTGMRRIDRAHPAPGMPACVNGIDGRPTALYGACYAPKGSPQEADGSVIAQARAAGMTALYVLSRARDAFYDACDAQGMMVFQELPLQEEIAREFIRTLGAHPCIVQWSAAPLRDVQGRPTDTAHPRIAPLVHILNDYADERPFAGAAPSGAGAQLGMDALGRGLLLHALGPEYPLGPDVTARYFNQDDAPYRTILMPALLSYKRLRQAAGGYPYWPPTQKGVGRNALWTYRGGIWPPMERTQLSTFLGEDLSDDAQAMCVLTRFLQAECVRYALEQARFRGAFGLFILRLGATKAYLSDDVLVESDGCERPAYHAFAQAMRPDHVCARLYRTGYWVDTHFDAFVRILCDKPREEAAEIEAALLKNDGIHLAKETFPCTLRTGEYGCLSAQLPDEPGPLTLRLTLRAGDKMIDQSDQMICVGLCGPLWPLAHLPRTVLRLREGLLENAGAFTAHGVSAPGLPWRALLPGERVAFSGGPDDVECMNAIME